jgi:hypothetical protein
MDQDHILSMHTHPSTHPAVEILPSEILSHVFVVGANSLDTDFELLVSHVSRRWRAVSIDTQELWDKVSMHMPLDRVSTYVHRSKACKLSIIISPRLDAATGIPLQDEHVSESMESFLEMVMPAAHRWRRLIVWTCNHVGMANALNRIMRLSVPQLEALQFMQETNEAPLHPIVSGDIFQSFFSGALSLTLARFDLVHLPWISFSATNLQQLHISGLSGHITMNYNQLRQALTSSPRLVKLALMGAFPNVDGHISYLPIVLPALESLHVFSLDPSHNDLSVFHILSTPVLRSLEVDEVEDLNAFISDVNTTPPKYPFVTSLTLNDISLPLENLDIFSAFPKVSYFDVTGCDAFRLFSHWSFRVVRPDKSVLWPDLHTLFIDRRSCSDTALTRIIKFRNKYGKPLRTLRMTKACRRRYSARMLQWLNEQVTIEIVPSVHGEGREEQDVEGREEVNDEEGLGFHAPEFDPYEEMYDPNDSFPEDADWMTPNEANEEADIA